MRLYKPFLVHQSGNPSALPHQNLGFIFFKYSEYSTEIFVKLPLPFACDFKPISLVWLGGRSIWKLDMLDYGCSFMAWLFITCLIRCRVARKSNPIKFPASRHRPTFRLCLMFKSFRSFLFSFSFSFSFLAFILAFIHPCFHSSLLFFILAFFHPCFPPFYTNKGG